MPSLAQKRRHKRRLLQWGASFVAISLVLGFFANRGLSIKPIEQAALSTGMPAVESGRAARGFLGQLRQAMSGAADLTAENERLRRKLAEAEISRANAETRIEEFNHSTLLAAQLPSYAPFTQTAPVIAPLLDGKKRGLWIGLGIKDGLEPGQAVIGPNGVIGAIDETWISHSTVRLLTDRDSRWGGELDANSELGIVSGTGDGQTVVLQPDKTAVEIEPGDQVLTSGTRGSLAPSGLLLGTVIDVGIDDNGERSATLIIPEQGEELRHVYILNQKQIAWEPSRN